MTTIPDSIKGTLDAGWTAAGGAEPTYYVTEDYTYTSQPPLGKDFIWVIAKSLHTVPEAKNDTYSNITHTVEIVVNSTTTADRLKEISDEVVRILDSTAITGVQWQKCSNRQIVTPEGLRNHQELITVRMIELLASSTSAYGANTAASYLNELLMYGSANAAWVPCVYIDESSSTRKYYINAAAGTILNVDDTDTNMRWDLPLPTVKGSLKLYISGVRLSLLDADAGDYVNTTTVYGKTTTGGLTSLASDTTNYNTAATLFTYTFAAADCSSYLGVMTWLAVVATNAADFDIMDVQVRCYYDV